MSTLGPDVDVEVEQVRKEAAFYKRQLEELSATTLRQEYTVTSLRHQLRQRQHGLLLLAELQQAVGTSLALPALLERVVRTIDERLGMDRVVVFVPAPPSGRLSALASAPAASGPVGELEVGSEELGGPLLVTSATPSSPLVERVREALGVPFFVCVPVGVGPRTVGLLVAGRLIESAPYRLPLDQGDVDALQAVAGLVMAFAQGREIAELEAERERRSVELEKARELAEAYRDLEQAHLQLKRAQAELVQQEKMASLGRLTAGIAHELKNPLNFVNNFSCLSVDLVEELRQELGAARGRTVEEAMGGIEPLLDDLAANADRVREHGERADAIVRGMMMHARGGVEGRRAVDLNALVEEHVRQATGARPAGELTVSVERDYAPSVGEVTVSPRAIGRVVVSLVSNALDAVAERAQGAVGGDGEGGYVPRVAVRTQREGERVEVVVEDNGAGIPEGARARLFEPFNTTKPAGLGHVGLGLSLARESVAGHEGTLTAESEAGVGTALTVTLPAVVSVPGHESEGGATA